MDCYKKHCDRSSIKESKRKQSYSNKEIISYPFWITAKIVNMIEKKEAKEWNYSQTKMEIHGTKKYCNMKVKRSKGNILGGK